MSNPAEVARPASEPPRCLNCEAFLAGPFCAQCGQRDHDLDVSLRHIANEFAEDYFHLDSKLPRSLALLVATPGRLTREFIAGHRVRYVGPFKLYVLCSVLFFLAVAVLPNVHRGAAVQTSGSSIKVDFDKVGTDDPLPVRLFAQRLKARYQGETPQELSRHATDALVRYMPDAMLVLMPVFALMLKLLYRKRFYAEHFVTALHLHALAFLMMLVLAVSPPPWLNQLVLLAFLVHGAISLRRIYEQGWGRTVLKVCVLGFVYTVTVSVAIVGVTLAGLLIG